MAKQFQPVNRLLLGPGPSEVYPTVLEQMKNRLLGHLDPQFLQLMDELKTMLKDVFETRNELTLAMPGTGSAGMETIFVNLVEPGDKVIIGVNGIFGGRMVDVAERAGAEVIAIKQSWGEVFSPDSVEAALKAHPDATLVALVHAETSTGALQPLQEIVDLVHRYGKIFVADAVTSLGGARVGIDAVGIDAAYSGTQKCLSAPPGLSPITLGERALQKIDQRKTKVQSWYLDLTMIRNYWGEDRFYHHTAPITMNYALHEALRLLFEEGLDSSFARHALNGKALQNGLEALGLQLVVDEKYRLPTLTTVYVPEGIQDAAVRKTLLEHHNIEIGGGLGPFKGKAWRIGLMGHGSQKENVLRVLESLEDTLSEQGYVFTKGIGSQAALKYYTTNELKTAL